MDNKHMKKQNSMNKTVAMEVKKNIDSINIMFISSDTIKGTS